MDRQEKARGGCLLLLLLLLVVVVVVVVVLLLVLTVPASLSDGVFIEGSTTFDGPGAVVDGGMVCVYRWMGGG
jgi:hypothetical protein